MSIFTVISETRTSYRVQDSNQEVILDKNTCAQPYYVGDRLRYDSHHFQLIERKNLVTKSSNQTMKTYHQLKKEQVLASNIDQIIILIALDRHFSLSKLERFYLVFYQEGIDLQFLLTKKDMANDYQKTIEHIRGLYPQINVTAINNNEKESVNHIRSLLKPNTKVLLLGASGAGKSTLINNLFQTPLIKTNQTRTDGKGRHTTTSSLLLQHPELQLSIIDTPGFKGIDKVQNLDLSHLFPKIIEIARQCHFPKCHHQNEAKCAVKLALKEGTICRELWDRYFYHSNKY